MSEIREGKNLQKIVGIGACVMDTLITVPHYPKEDTKLKAVEVRAAGGGPTATGLVAAARLGIEAGYIGVLSDDNGGTFLKQDFEKYGVDISHVEIKGGYRSFTSTIWLANDNATRTCVFDRGNLPPLNIDEAAAQAIAAADILMIDGNEMDAAEAACMIAREHNTKVLYDCGGLYQGVERLLKLTDIMIPSEEFAMGHTGCSTVNEAAEKLYDMYHPEVVVVTCGKEGGMIYRGKKTENGAVQKAVMEKYPAFLVEAVDTNGSGDVFHGAYAAGMVKGLSYEECCYFASAVSALKCTGIGARESVPDYETVKQFLAERGYSLSA